MRRRRPDGTLVTEVANYRRMMPYLMRGRNESAVYFQQQIDITRTEAFLDDVNRRGDLQATLFQLALWSGVRTLDRHPNLNRFVAGGRLWQRDGIWLTYAAKKRMTPDAPLVPIKRRFDPAEPFPDMVRAMQAALAEGRSDRRSSTDRELALVLRLPGPALRVAMAAVRAADAWGLLPRWFIEGDPLYTSAFAANLGSLKMDAATHHLYEYGTASLFAVLGRVGPLPVVEGETVVSRRHLTIQWSFDERIDDGMNAFRALETFRSILEDPEAAGAGAGLGLRTTAAPAGAG